MNKHISEIYLEGEKIGEHVSCPMIGSVRIVTMTCPDCFSKKTVRSVFTENGWLRENHKHKCNIPSDGQRTVS